MELHRCCSFSSFVVRAALHCVAIFIIVLALFVECGLKNELETAMDAAELAALGDDCSLIFEKQQGSNWLPANAAPRCALERLALAVLEQWL